MRTKNTQRLGLADQAAEIVEQVTPHVEAAVEAARERIVNDYLPAAQGMLADARDVAREVAQDAREAAQEAAANAEKSTRKSRKKAARKARTKAGELAARAAVAAPVAAPLANKVAEKVEPKPRRRKRFVLLLGLLGAGAVVMKRLRSGSPAASYSPPRPAPTPRPAPVATEPITDGPASSMPTAPAESHVEPDPVADAAAESLGDAGPGTDLGGTTDAGGAFLDEVAADADEQPHQVTTPDNPLEVEDVAEAGKSKRR